MYFNPFRDFLKRVLFGARTMRRGARLRSQSRSRHLSRRDVRSFSLAAEVCEARMLLSGPQLIQVTAGTTPTIGVNLASTPADGTVRASRPQSIDLHVQPGGFHQCGDSWRHLGVSHRRRGGLHRSRGSSGAPTVGTGSQANIVTLRFANSLPDDQYQIEITNALKDTSNNAFVPPSGTVQDVDFTVDFGAQVVSVVPQPVVQSQILNVSGLNTLLTNVESRGDGD